MVPHVLMNIPAKIVKRKGRTAYELTFPIELLESLGWINERNKNRIFEKDKERDRKEEIEVTISPEMISKRSVLVEIKKDPKTGFYPKRMVEYRKNNQKEKKSYEKRKKENLQIIKERQFKSGINKINWDLNSYP